MTSAESEDDRHRAEPAAAPATFEDIVADLRAEGALPAWPEDGPLSRQGRPQAPQPAPPRPEVRQPEVPTPPAEDDHFVPPEPPPLPQLGRSAAIGVGLIGAGVLLLVSPGLLGIAESVGLPLGLFALAGGLGWLVLRSWSTDGSADEDDDGGAVL